MPFLVGDACVGGTKRKKRKRSKEEIRMKARVFFAAAVLFAGMSAPAFATYCDVKKADEDKQAKCAEKCEDAWIAHKMVYGADIDKVKVEAKACFEKCGCDDNYTKDVAPVTKQ